MNIKSICIPVFAMSLILQSPLNVSAQILEETKLKKTKNSAHIGLVYPLSNHGTNAGLYANLFSLHGIAGVSKNERAVSISGLANIIHGEAKGMQLAGLLNLYRSGKGGQIAGFTNLSTAKVNGVQLSGFLNKAGDVKGVQLAGFINIAKKVEGVQFAGFINIAESSDYPIGIVNLIKSGTKAIGMSIDEDLTSLVSFRSGGQVMYGIVGLGYNLQNKEHKYAFEAGIGAHLLTYKSFSLNAEVSNTGIIDFENGMFTKGSLRLLPAYKITKNIEIFGGPVASHIFTNTKEGMDMIKNEIWKKSLEPGEMNVVNVGFIGGLQVYF